jgi:Ankyrin repeats (3 copies)
MKQSNLIRKLIVMDIVVTKQGGKTSLIVAAEGGHLPVVKLLLYCKANINHVDKV